MRVRITAPQGYADRYGDFHPHGAHVEYPDALAQKLISHGMATRVHEKQEEVPEPPIETAMVEAPEKAVKPRGRPRKK